MPTNATRQPVLLRAGVTTPKWRRTFHSDGAQGENSHPSGILSRSLQSGEPSEAIFQRRRLLNGGLLKRSLTGDMEEEVELYQPFQRDQITLPEEAQCMAVKTLLHMCGIRFSLRLRANAEYMSPSGGVPFIKVGPQIVSEFDPIVEYLDLKDISLSRELSGSQRSEMKAYMSLTTNRLYNAEVYLSWCCQPVANRVTKARYGAPYPWPLNKILPWYRQQEAKKYLKVQEWLEKTPEEVREELRSACKALSDKLGDQYYFFLDRPSELDALVYGHLYSLLTFQLIDDRIADIVNGFPNLTRYVQRIQEKYFVAGSEEAT